MREEEKTTFARVNACSSEFSELVIEDRESVGLLISHKD